MTRTSTITPTAVVRDVRGNVRYRGRIDNLYINIGRTRQQVTSHDLTDALDAVLAGTPGPTREHEALGLLHRAPTVAARSVADRCDRRMPYELGSVHRCRHALVSATARVSPPAAAQKSAVTFSETIAPIVYANCVTCHRPGEAAPFSLITYDDVRRRGKLLVTVTQQRLMPPWQATHGYGDFEGERRLTDAADQGHRRLGQRGHAAGRSLSKMPPLPTFPDGWHLGTPDLVLRMTEPFDVPASGPDVFRNFVIPSGLTEDKWVRAVEFRPSARAVVHHALFAYVPGGSLRAANGADGRPGFRGLAPIGLTGRGGGGLVRSAAGRSAGRHAFFPTGRRCRSRATPTSCCRCTSTRPARRSANSRRSASTSPRRRRSDGWLNLQLPGLFGVGAGIDIPAGEKAYTIQSSATMPVDVKLFAVNPHAHYLGKEMKATATLPDGTTRPLLWIQDWDFNWQDGYNYKEPVVLPKGTRIDVTIVYDNSAEQPAQSEQPAAPRPVGGAVDRRNGHHRLPAAAGAAAKTKRAWQPFAAQWLRQTVFSAVRNGTVERLRESRALQGVQ